MSAAEADIALRAKLDDSAQRIVAASFNGHSLAGNCSTEAQSLTAATRTYINGTNLQFAAGALAAGVRFRWTLSISKTAAGTAASTFGIAFGKAGTTADTTQVSFSKKAGTAAVDTGRVVIEATVRTGGASGVVAGHFHMTHDLASTGFMTTACSDVITVSSAFNMTAITDIGIVITTGAGEAVTVQAAQVEAWSI